MDIHDGLNNTLMLLKHRLKANTSRPAVEVVQEYAPLPHVECYPGLLNQVFMNILANAIDALDEKAETQSPKEWLDHPGHITVQTSWVHELGKKWIQVVIADNGAGMSPSVQQRIFDPFFTTKPIGKGTGMGMSISYQVVTERHSGQLSCSSIVGNGTTFTIKLPMTQTSLRLHHTVQHPTAIMS
ncbi:MAG: hypothetical protein F6K16_36490 [Symploca sp. SIO2B6]|nr:hypothetical protein [Symploca sp. SIO2B6]